MSFDYSSLITDRTVSDSDTLKALLGKPMAEWTAEELTAFNRAVMKGSYNYTDLNRVDACLEDLVARLGRLGYSVPGYERVKIPRTAQPSGRLPEGYTELAYIQSTGTQYVDTGVKPNQDTRIVLDINASPTTAAAWLFGARNNNTDRTFNLLSFNSQYRSDYNNSTDEYSTVNPSGRFTVDKDGNITKFNGTVGVTAVYGDFQCTYSLFLFANNNAGTAAGFGSLTLYACQIYDDGTLVRDFIPCRNPSGEAGLYDLVEGKFYGNSGSGVLLGGPQKVSLPEGYTQLEYIQSSGTQRVDTGFKPNQDSRVLIDAEILSGNTGTDHHIGSVFSNSQYWTLRLRSGRDGYAARYDGRALTNISHTGAVFARHWFDQNKNKVQVDGGTVTTFTAATWSATANLPIFCYTSGGTSFTGYISMRLRAHQIHDGDTLVRNFIPCKNASGAVGLYDTVGAEFYPNAGTGSFTAGSAVTWPEDPDEPSGEQDPYTWYENDVPTAPLMTRYRANVAAVRGALALPEGTPAAPETMRRLTPAAANSIEAVLLALDIILTNLPAAVRHCGVTVCGSKGVIA